MNVKTASRILDIFEAFASAKKPLTLSELASTLEIPVSSCFALLRTLENRGYIHMLASRHEMYPTRRLYRLSLEIIEHDAISQSLQNRLEKLRVQTGETVTLSKLHKDEVVYIDVYESTHSIRYNAEIGERKKLYCSSAGKSFLGLLKDQDLRKKISGLKLKPLTDKTITNNADLFNDVSSSRDNRGWFLNVSESVKDLVGVATTIKTDGTNYSVSIVGPIYRMMPDLEEIARRLLEAKKNIETDSNNIG